MIRNVLLTALSFAAAVVMFHAGARAAGAPGCAAPPAPGLSSVTIESGGVPRSFSLYLPRSYAGEAAVPLVLDLHASGISPEIELRITGLDGAAEAQGFIVALPAAATPWPRGGFTWNIPRRDGGADDVTFIADLLDVLHRDFCIDPARVYAAGYSGGARLASELACALPHRFAAIGVVAGLRHPGGPAGACRPGGRPVPLVAFHSVDDPVNPYRPRAEGAPPYWTYGVDEALQRRAAYNGCAAVPEETVLAEGVAHLRYRDCDAGRALEFYRLAGSGHTWPGSDFDFPAFVGTTESRLEATAVMLRFFQRFRLPVE